MELLDLHDCCGNMMTYLDSLGILLTGHNPLLWYRVVRLFPHLQIPLHGTELKLKGNTTHESRYISVKRHEKTLLIGGNL